MARGSGPVLARACPRPDAWRLRSSCRTRDFRFHRRLRARHLGPPSHAACRTPPRRPRRSCRSHACRKRLSARRRRRDAAWRTPIPLGRRRNLPGADPRRRTGPDRTRPAAPDHRAHSPGRGNGRRPSAHLRARLLPRRRPAQGVGHRPAWSPLHRQVSEGDRRLQHGDLGGDRAAAGRPSRHRHPATRTDRGGRQGGHAVATLRSRLARSASPSCPRWR